ncbi:acrosomal protein SP-10 [Tenrec ecaudatus]|uniref:acrosomal protein SP-10 n=1 Tax=Tenrec ecaudatus TaxID=94439 RepID=UPI003F59B940
MVTMKQLPKDNIVHFPYRVESGMKDLSTSYKVSAKKAQLCTKIVTYLGYKLKDGNQTLSNSRIQAIQAIPKPTTKRQIGSKVLSEIKNHNMVKSLRALQAERQRIRNNVPSDQTPARDEESRKPLFNPGDLVWNPNALIHSWEFLLTVSFWVLGCPTPGLLLSQIQMRFLLLIYLLGSARGASGQPDEPLGSIDHQASIHQLSSEYFPLANPSDAESLYESIPGEHSLSEHSSSENTSGEQASSDQSVAEQSSGEKVSSEKASGDKSSSDKVSGDKVSGEKSSGEKVSSEQASGEKSGEQSAGEKSGDKASGEKSSGEQSSSDQSSAAGLSCHTCSYMNEQGKCLRGEGVCSTQNSQQCMLKKIFEGGKLQFMVQGCENMCPSMNLFSHGTRMQIICCRNQSFCNKI